jgi:hypothetical protein
VIVVDAGEQVRSKMVGVGALGFASCVLGINLVENVVASRPDPGGGAEEVLAWAIDAEVHLWVSTILLPVSIFFLFAFVVGLAWRLRSAGRDSTMAIVGGIGATGLFGTLSAAIASDAVLISRAEDLSLEMVAVLNDFTTVLFILNWAVLALTFWALSRAAWTVGLIPRWLERVSLVGAAALWLGSTQAVSALRGTLPPLLVGLLGFGIWLLFLIVAGVRGLRSDTSASAESPARDRQVRVEAEAALTAEVS